MQASGKLPASKTVTIVAGNLGVGFKLPATVNLTSKAPGRKVELSTDGGLSFKVPELDFVTAESVSFRLLAPVSHLKFTGSANDVWGVL